ncbi:MAG: lactate racemase domain-containing protein [Pirellulaceae bacterium]|nr:lactate racemase domain-containing protein [Pirellulaceae bacterium]
MSTYEFGIDSEFSLPDEIGVSQYGAPAGEAVDDAKAAVLESLQNPHGFPPLNQTIVPGDQVTLAIGEGLPQVAAVVAGVVNELLSAGIEADAIRIVRSAVDARLSRANPTRDLPAPIRDRIEVVVHDSSDRECLSLLGHSVHEDQPVYVNRQIVDADVVLPLGVIKASGSLGYLGVHGMLFPTFADDETQRRFNAPESSLADVELSRRQEEAKEASWMLGVRMTIQVVPGVGDQLVEVLSGDATVIDQIGRERCGKVWGVHVPERASLVVATLPGGREQQSWSNFARVLDAALRVVRDDGAIAVCCDLSAKPGPALKRLAGAESLDSANHAVQNDRSYDALTATQLVRTLQRARVYMLSQLEEDVVESLGVAYVSCPEELIRLASHYDSCILLQNAHQAVPIVESEEE